MANFLILLKAFSTQESQQSSRTHENIPSASRKNDDYDNEQNNNEREKIPDGNCNYLCKFLEFKITSLYF